MITQYPSDVTHRHHTPAPPTPLRALGTRTDGGYLLVRDPGSSYRDGGERRVLEIIQASPDRSSGTDGMLRQAANWPEQYHLDPARANLLRALDLPTDARVLEVGAGCGAVTRYLGERCTLVDALEPVPSRAAAAQARTADLDSVEVIVAAVDDVPAEAVYDLLVVVGVLEYVGDGSADPGPYHDFLARLARLLRPGGTLILAIENKLGVKYLCGAAEDHSGRAYDSIEDYPYGAPARTFDRSELCGLLAGVGLDPRPLIAFPDYKITRAVLDPDGFPPDTESLLYRVPSFPSADYLVPRGPGPSEERVWRSLVRAGLAGQTGNSFVVLAHAAGETGSAATAGDADSAAAAAQHPLWPDGRAGVFFGHNRPEPYAIRTEIRRTGETVTFDRTLLNPAADRGNSLGLDIQVGQSAFVRGVDLLDLLVDADDPATVTALHDWRDLVRERCADGGPAPLDLIPRNLVVADGVLEPIDQEWSMTGLDADAVLQRGALLTAVHLLLLGRLVGRWRTCITAGDVARAIGAIVQPDWPADWVAGAVEAEARFQAEASVVQGTADLADARARAREVLNGAMTATITGRSAESPDDIATRHAPASGPTQDARHADPEALIWANARIADLDRELARLRTLTDGLAAASDLQQERAEAELARAQRLLVELDCVRATLSWRITAPLRWVRTRLTR